MKRIAVFASGRGSNFQAIINKINEGFIPAQVVLLITNNPDAGAIKIAASNHITAKVLIPKEFESAEEYNEAILAELEQTNVQYIVLAGYLKLIGRNIVQKYENKILNIHPALLPAFGGKGMYGFHVHEAIFERGVKLSGVSVHLVNSEYDAGPIVLQKSVFIGDVRSAQEIADRVLKIEHEIYPQAVKLLVEERLSVDKRRVRISGETKIEKDQTRSDQCI